MVLDSSALVELLLNTAIGQAVAVRIADPTLGLHVPPGGCRGRPGTPPLREDGELDAAALAPEDLHALDLQRHAHQAFLDRVWQLRHNLRTAGMAARFPAPLGSGALRRGCRRGRRFGVRRRTW
jgi:hypothetical protein